jgi:hypothetical protein
MPFTLIGMGLGPLLVGGLSEGLHATYGEDSLRYALVAASGLMPIGALGFLFAARNLRAEIARTDATVSLVEAQPDPGTRLGRS